MSVKIRLKRMGSKKRPFYRIVVADSLPPLEGRFSTSLGTNTRLTSRKEVNFDEDAVMEWLQKGAQPSDTVRNMLQKAGVMKKYHEAKYAKK